MEAAVFGIVRIGGPELVSGVARIWTWDSQLCTMLGSFFETPVDDTHLV